MTAIALTLLALGIVTQIAVLAASKPTLPRFTKVCPTCGLSGSADGLSACVS